jgi:hypothetical protein
VHVSAVTKSLETILSGASKEECAKFYARNAERVYRV